MSDISKINPNGTEYNLKDATARNAIQSSKTVSGNVVTVTDAAPINAEDITVDITPKQDLHGYGRPWVGGGWKNKLPMTVEGIKALNTVGTWNGNVYTINNGTIEILVDGANNVIGIKFNGTFNDPVFFVVGQPNVSGTFKLVGCPSGGEFETTYGLYQFRPNTGAIAYDSGNGQIIYVAVIDFIQIVIRRGYTATNLIFKPMVCDDTSATYNDFAPYSNICPIEGRTGAELDRAGKNLFNNVWESGAIDTNTGEDTPMNGVVRTGYAGIEGVDIYTMSNYNYGNTNNFFVVLCYDQNKTYLGQVPVTVFDRTASQENEKFTVLTNTKYVRFYIASATLGSESTQYLHKGETALSYEPYQGQHYTASFGQTVHGGKWHVTAGGTDKTYGYVEFDGSDEEGWTTGLLSNCFSVARGIIPSGLSYNNYITNSFTPIPTGVELNSGEMVIGNSYINVNYMDKCPDIQAWRAYLAQHPLQICYELATPTTLSTPKQNVPMLQGINTVYADCGDTQLKYQPDNVVGELKGEIEDSIIYEDYKWTTESSRTYSAGTPGTYGCSSWRDVKKEGYDVIGVTFVENRRFGDCILTLYYIPSTSRVEVIIFRATSSSVTIADEDITYRVAYKKH